MTVIFCKSHSQGICKGTFECLLPTRTLVMQIRSPPGSLPSRVNLYTTFGANQSYQRPLGIDFPAANTGSLGDMLGAMGRLFRHVGFSDRL